MLTKMSLESARILAEELNRRRVVVQVLPETPLERLVEAGRTPVEVEPETVEASVESLALNTVTSEETGIGSHDGIMDDITAKVVGLMDRRLTLARTVINPLISNYANAMANAIGDLVPTTPEVTEVDFGDFYDNPIIRDVFSGYGYSELEPLPTLSGIQFNDENNYYQDSLTTGSSAIDNKLKDIIDTRGEEWYRNLGRRYFTQGEDLVLAKPELSETYAEVIDENLVAHMLARHFYNLGDPVNKDNALEYETKLLKILGRTSQNLNLLWKYKDDLDKRGIVTNTYSTESQKVAVYAPNYRKYLELGGSRTALMGHTRQNGSRYSVEKLIENKAALENIYDTEVNNKLRQLRSDKYRLLQSAALQNLHAVIEQIPQEVISTIPALVSQPVEAKVTLLERGRNFINSPKGIDLDDIDAYAEDIILLGLLPELELHQFMRGMDKYLKPAVGVNELTPKQAAYYVVLEEVVRFFMSQTSLSGKQ